MWCLLAPGVDLRRYWRTFEAGKKNAGGCILFGVLASVFNTLLEGHGVGGIMLSNGCSPDPRR